MLDHPQCESEGQDHLPHGLWPPPPRSCSNLQGLSSTGTATWIHCESSKVCHLNSCPQRRIEIASDFVVSVDVGCVGVESRRHGEVWALYSIQPAVSQHLRDRAGGNAISRLTPVIINPNGAMDFGSEFAAIPTIVDQGKKDINFSLAADRLARLFILESLAYNSWAA